MILFKGKRWMDGGWGKASIERMERIWELFRRQNWQDTVADWMWWWQSFQMEMTRYYHYSRQEIQNRCQLGRQWGGNKLVFILPHNSVRQGSWKRNKEVAKLKLGQRATYCWGDKYEGKVSPNYYTHIRRVINFMDSLYSYLGHQY